jgi:hypothetical protein
MADVPKRPPHLKDLFKTGEMIEIPVLNPEDPEDPIKVQIWLRKPTSSQHEEAMNKGRAAQARRRSQYRDKDSDLYVSLQEEIDSYTTKEDVVERLLTFEESKRRNQAYHETLYVETDDDEEEPRWGKEGSIYIDLLTALRERYEEIQRHNAEITPDQEHLKIKLETDEEILRLNAEEEEFQGEVESRVTALYEREKALLMGKPSAELRETCIKRMMELDLSMIFYQEYKSNLLFHACRLPDQKDRYYWDSPADLWDQPQYVQMAIINAMDELEMGVDELKNSLSLLSS